MAADQPTTTRHPATVIAEQYESERHNLALHALSTLARQFAIDPDFSRLIQTFLLTLSGQFSVGCSSIFLPEAQLSDKKGFFASTDVLHCATYIKEKLLDSSELTQTFPGYGARRLESLEVKGERGHNLIDGLKEAGAAVVIPLLTGDRTIGVVCLSGKVTRRPFSDTDLELLDTMIGTITPFISNSLLFHKISNLGAWYLDILNSVRQGVFVFDQEVKLRKVNTTGLMLLQTFLGTPADMKDYRGQTVEDVFPNDTFPGWAAHVRHGLEKNNCKSMSNSVVRWGDDERVFTLRLSATAPQPDRPIGFIVTVDDVTNQRASEQRLFDLQKFAEKGVMASSISHELNNFLGLILGGVEIGQIALKKSNLEKLGTTLEKLRANVMKMERFTAGLTDFTKMNTSKKHSDLNNVIQDVISFTSVQKRFKGIDIATDLDTTIPKIEVDPDQIAQLLLNFLNNAADAIRELDRHDGKITISTGQSETAVHFRVSDNGSGIDPRIKDSLFRVHLSTKEKGHGYGLVTCARIIENHKAEIQIDSEPGDGATFTVTLPLVCDDSSVSE